MSSCPSCLRAQQVPDHRDYRAGCIGCEVRELAQMEPGKRRNALQVLLVKCGRDAYERVRLDTLREVARMERLRRLARRERT